MGEPCIRCAHAAEEHEPDLGYCEHGDCRCLMYVSEEDELEDALASGDEPEPLDFDADGER